MTEVDEIDEIITKGMLQAEENQSGFTEVTTHGLQSWPMLSLMSNCGK